MRSEAVIDRLLTDAAETLIRNRSRRPRWLPAGFPMKLILTIKREALVAHLIEDRALRARLRTSSRRLIDSSMLDGVTAADFDDRMASSADPHRLVATALVDEDQDLVATAAAWALDPTGIPVRPPPTRSAEATAPVSPNLSDGDATLPAAGAFPGTCANADAGPSVVVAANVAVPASLEPARLAGPDPLAAALVGERDRLLEHVARLEAQLLELRTQVPSKGQRSRQNKQQGELKRALLDSEAANEQLTVLRSERDVLIQIRKELDDQLAEAEAARGVALRKSQHLERQLASSEGRADYLRRSVDKEMADARVGAENLPYGRDRTDATRRAEVLAKLSAALDEAFPEETEPQARVRRVTAGKSHDFTVTPLGGGTEIGGSAILVEAAGRRILVDAGMHPDGRGPARIDELGTGRLDALVVTHAHNDHAGYIPALVDRFPNLRVICSYATAHLLPTMWADSAKVMERAFRRSRRYDQRPPAPLRPSRSRGRRNSH